MNGLLESVLGPHDVPLTLAILAVKGFIVLAVATGFCLLLRRASASLRHLCWSVALASLLLIPLLSALLPSISLEVFPPSSEAVDAPAWEVSSSSIGAATTVGAASSETAPKAASSVGASSAAAPRAAASPSKAGSAAGPATAVYSTHSSAAVSGTPSAARSDVRSALLAVWALVAGGILVHMLVGIFSVRWMIRRSNQVHDRQWIDLVDEVGDRLFIRRPVRVMMNPSVRVPMTWGVLRPVVVLPAEAEAWSDEKRRCVLAHEMAHVKRLDCLTQSLATVACAIHWFNPLVWRAAKSMRLEREKACDDTVLHAARTKASDYASHLLDIARGVPESFAAPSVAVTMARRSQLEGRVLSILDRDRRRSFRPAPAAAAIVLGAAATLALSPVHPVEQPNDLHSVVHAGATEFHPKPSWEPTKSDFGSAAGTPVDDVIKRSFEVAPGGLLSIDTDVGNIEVRTSNRNTVDVEIHRRVRGSADVEDFNVEFEHEGDDVEIIGENRRERNWGDDGLNIRFTVMVPREYNLDLQTEGGNIAIDDLDGTVDVQTAGGNLSFGRIRGSIDAQTSGGNVSIDGSEGDVDVHTSGGNIRLGKIGGTADVRTSGGNILVEEVNGDIEAVTSGGVIEARLAQQPEGDCLLKTSGGSITLYLADDIAVDIDAQTSAGQVISDLEVAMSGEIRRDRLRGTINGGGPELVLDTSAGDVHIRRL